MKECGCKRIYVGVESGNDDILRSIKKGLSKEQIRNGIAEIMETGIEVSASYIVGLPGETRKTIEETVNFAIENNTD